MRLKSALFSALIVLLIGTSVSAAGVHPIWGPLNEGSSTYYPPRQTVPSAISRYISRPILRSGSYGAEQRYNVLQERVCERVDRRFSRDPIMLERIDRRLKTRFNFTCSYVADAPVHQDNARLTVDNNLFGSVGDTVPRGATNVPMLSIDFTASCDRDITMNALSVRDKGLGLLSDIFGVWLQIDGERVSRAHTLYKDKTASLTFHRPLVIEACTTQTIDVMAAFAETAIIGGLHSFEIDGDQWISANAAVTGPFPITGEEFEVGTALSGRLNVEYKPIEEVARFGGSEEQVIGRFSLTVDTTEEQTLHSMTFENNGNSRDGDFVAIFLRGRFGRTPFTETMQHTVDDYVTLRFDPPFSLEKGESIDLDVVADIVTNTGSTVQMQFEELFDIYSVGNRYGYGTNGQLYGSRVRIDGSPSKVELR